MDFGRALSSHSSHSSLGVARRQQLMQLRRDAEREEQEA
jgi:hypothetical protein